MLDRVRHGGDFDSACEHAFAELPDADRRLAHELAAGVLRQSGALDRRLGPLISGGWATVAPPLQDVLRLGAYQLTVLDRVPPHAAVSTSVTLAKELRGTRAGGFVNAVLRRLPLDERPPSLSMAPADLATAYAHPAWLVERWVDRFGVEGTRRLLEWNNQRPRLVLQPARRDLAEIRAQLNARNIESTPAPFEAGLSVEAGRPRELPGYHTGDFHIQDPAQALVLRFIDPSPDDMVFDACAAPGGKAIALGRVTRSVIAAEIQRDRLRRLLENIRRAGSGRERPILADAAHPPVRPVDLALLDAPCLATGTMARHPDARTRVSFRALERLTDIQRELLTRVASVVRPDGLLVYATCSLEPEENELQVDRFLSENAEFRREPPKSVPAELLSPAGDLVILPHRHGMDGAYAGRLRRAAA